MSRKQFWIGVVVVLMPTLGVFWINQFVRTYGHAKADKDIIYEHPSGGWKHHSYFKFKWHQRREVHCEITPISEVSVLDSRRWEIVAAGTYGCDGTWDRDFIYPYADATMRDRETGQLLQSKILCYGDAQNSGVITCREELIDVTGTP